MVRRGFYRFNQTNDGTQIEMNHLVEIVRRFRLLLFV